MRTTVIVAGELAAACKAALIVLYGCSDVTAWLKSREFDLSTKIDSPVTPGRVPSPLLVLWNQKLNVPPGVCCPSPSSATPPLPEALARPASLRVVLDTASGVKPS